MTEDEAKGKWCPMVRSANMDGETTINRITLARHNAGWDRCIASDCMMWRFETLYENMPASGRIVENGRSGTEGYCCGMCGDSEPYREATQ